MKIVDQFRDGVTGSTCDSGSHCLGSNPSPGANYI